MTDIVVIKELLKDGKYIEKPFARSIGKIATLCQILPSDKNNNTTIIWELILEQHAFMIEGIANTLLISSNIPDGLIKEIDTKLKPINKLYLILFFKNKFLLDNSNDLVKNINDVNDYRNSQVHPKNKVALDKIFSLSDDGQVILNIEDNTKKNIIKIKKIYKLLDWFFIDLCKYTEEELANILCDSLSCRNKQNCKNTSCKNGIHIWIHPTNLINNLHTIEEKFQIKVKFFAHVLKELQKNSDFENNQPTLTKNKQL